LNACFETKRAGDASPRRITGSLCPWLETHSLRGSLGNLSGDRSRCLSHLSRSSQRRNGTSPFHLREESAVPSRDLRG
jgi:hypothetical protein